MIIVFSGTGNSLLVASGVQKRLGGEIVELKGERIISPESKTIELDGCRHEGGISEPIVWVFPVYSWGVPPVVVEYIRKAKILGAYEAVHYLVCTCGDDVGRTHYQWRTLIGNRGWHPRGTYSVEMPNTYVLMKGFDTDSPEVEARKLDAMDGRLDVVADGIRRGSAVDDVVPGSGAFLKSALVYPVFKRFCMSPKGFHATSECISCGLCARQCPMENISMGNGQTPRWGKRCALCLRCYHICPRHAVAYDKVTDGKGQKKVFSLQSGR